MIEYIEGDIFKSPAQVIVNTVNTVGVMGKGLALEFKQRYPEMFSLYRLACEKKQLTIGKLMLWYAPDHWVLLFPTKENWRNPSKLEYIEKGLNKFVSTYAEKNITSIAFPRLGCGNGELNWDQVKPIMERYLKGLPIDVYIYLGQMQEHTPEHAKPKETINWLRHHAKDMSFTGLKDDLAYSSSIVPYKFNYEGKPISMKWDENLKFIMGKDTPDEIIDESTLYGIWDEIRNQGVFAAEALYSKNDLLCSLLEALGYLEKIKIMDTKAQKMKEGYQLNEGSGRMFSLKGEIK